MTIPKMLMTRIDVFSYLVVREGAVIREIDYLAED
jgi:hypothetical protein